MAERGVIRNIARKQQINDFSRLRFGNITPTDLDGVIEYKDRGYIFFEVKHGDTPLPFGQKLCMERLVRDAPSNKTAMAMVVEHEIADVNESIDVAECEVRELYSNIDAKMRWRKPKRKYNALKLSECFIDYIDKNGGR